MAVLVRGNSQTLLGHHTVNLLVQMMREKFQIHRPTHVQTSYATMPGLYRDDVLTWILKVCLKSIFLL